MTDTQPSVPSSAGAAAPAGPEVPFRGTPGGVLGGLGPAAAVYFLRRVIELTDARRDQDHVDLVVWQFGSVPDRTGFLHGRNESPEPALVANAVALERAGATFIAIPCNTAIVWVDAIRAAVGIEVLDTVDETVAAAQAAVPGLSTVGLLATDGTLEQGIYARAAKAAGLEMLVPEPEVQERVMTVIYDGVKAGNPVPREEFDALVDHLADRGAEAVLLGCTELSVLVGDLGVDDARVVDSIDAVARATILRAGGRLRA